MFSFRQALYKSLELTYMHKHKYAHDDTGDKTPRSDICGVSLCSLFWAEEKIFLDSADLSAVVHGPICLDRRRGVDAWWESCWAVNETILENDNELKSNQLIRTAFLRSSVSVHVYVPQVLLTSSEQHSCLEKEPEIAIQISFHHHWWSQAG